MKDCKHKKFMQKVLAVYLVENTFLLLLLLCLLCRDVIPLFFGSL